jgi:hypothetical protein
MPENLIDFPIISLLPALWKHHQVLKQVIAAGCMQSSVAFCHSTQPPTFTLLIDKYRNDNLPDHPIRFRHWNK